MIEMFLVVEHGNSLFSRDAVLGIEKVGPRYIVKLGKPKYEFNKSLPFGAGLFVGGKEYNVIVRDIAVSEYGVTALVEVL